MSKQMAYSSADTTLPKYEYDPLPGPNCIRLLEIISHSAGSGDFNGKLHVTDLKQDDRIPYKALSYSWALPEIAADPVERPPAPAVVIDGRRLAIGCNLFDFLEQTMVLPDSFDKPEDPHMIWIDAVCINQEDLTERGSQVEFMRDIYTFATSVVVWLGRHDVHSRLAIPLIASFAKVNFDALSLNSRQFQNRSLTDPEFYEHYKIKPLSLADWKDIRSFHSGSWFHRVLTVQELVVAEKAFFLCGETVLEWDDMSIFFATVTVRGWSGTLHINQFQETSRHQSIFGADMMVGLNESYREQFTLSPTDGSFCDLLLHFFEYTDQDSFFIAKFAWNLQSSRPRQVTGQRDRIFAPQGLASKYYKPGDWDILKPDYKKTEVEIFTQATRYILRKLRNLSFLSWVEDKSYRTYANLPSWVPDFSQLFRPVTLLYYSSYNTSQGIEVLLNGRNNTSFMFIADGMALSAYGVRVDVLDALSGDCEAPLRGLNVSALLKVAAQGPMIYHNGETRDKVLMKNLALGVSNKAPLIDNGPSTTFEELQNPFRELLKYHLAIEVWMWSLRSHGSTSWWDERKDLEEFCNQEPLIPSRPELEEYFTVFLALFPPSQIFKAKPVMDDAEFVKMFWDPAVPYWKKAQFGPAARSLWVSKEKYMGLALRSVCQGDEIWIIHGSRIPFVLRKQPDGSYAFLGEAYVHGIMDGEFFKRQNDLVIENLVLK